MGLRYSKHSVLSFTVLKSSGVKRFQPPKVFDFWAFSTPFHISFETSQFLPGLMFSYNTFLLMAANNNPCTLLKCCFSALYPGATGSIGTGSDFRFSQADCFTENIITA